MPDPFTNFARTDPFNSGFIDGLPGVPPSAQSTFHSFIPPEASIDDISPITTTQVHTLQRGQMAPPQDGSFGPLSYQMFEHPTHQNRSASDLSLQKVLLSTNDRSRMRGAIKTLAQQTFRPDTPLHGWKNSTQSSSFISGLEYSHLPNPNAWEHASTKDELYRLSGARMAHHYHKTGIRVQTTFSALSTKLKGKGRGGMAEARGEVAALQFMLTAMTENYTLKFGGAAANANNGIDQIWAERGDDGSVVNYLIVECKGSSSAHLGETVIGQQLSCAWLIDVLFRMASRETSYVGHNDVDRTVALAKKILNAVFNDDPTASAGLKVVSIKSLSGHNSVNQHNVLEICYYGDYASGYGLAGRLAEARTPPPPTTTPTALPQRPFGFY